MKNKKYWPSSNDPVWLEEGYRINESVFCETFISTHKIVFCNGFLIRFFLFIESNIFMRVNVQRYEKYENLYPKTSCLSI